LNTLCCINGHTEIFLGSDTPLLKKLFRNSARLKASSQFLDKLGGTHLIENVAAAEFPHLSRRCPGVQAIPPHLPRQIPDQVGGNPSMTTHRRNFQNAERRQ
jgi:hypothetical protein